MACALLQPGQPPGRKHPDRPRIDLEKQIAFVDNVAFLKEYRQCNR